MVNNTDEREASIPGFEEVRILPTTDISSLNQHCRSPESNYYYSERYSHDDLPVEQQEVVKQDQDEKECSSTFSSTSDYRQGVRSEKTVLIQHNNNNSPSLGGRQVPPSPLTDDESNENNTWDDSHNDTLTEVISSTSDSPILKDDPKVLRTTTNSQDECTNECIVATLQHQLQLSQGALESSEQQLKEAQRHILILQDRCADLEELAQQQACSSSTSSGSSHDTANNNVVNTNNHRDVVERLRAKNAALIEQCSLLQTMSDKDAAIIRDLRNSYASIHQQKVEMEIDFCNQLSALSATVRSMEDDHTEQLKAKQNTIASLKTHIQNQGNRIIQMQEEIYELKEELLNRAKVELNAAGTASSTYDEPTSKVLILEQEKKLLLERVEFLTLNRTSMTEEVDDLRDQVSRLSELDCKVVPHLEEQLEATRDTLKDLEQEMQTILRNHAKAIEEIENSLAVASLEKSRLEEDFLQQIVGLTKQKNDIVRVYQTENAEKDRIIKHMEKQISSLKGNIADLQSKSELEEISGREETDRLFQMQMVTEEKLSEQVAIIQELKLSLREEKKTNAALTKELKKLSSN